MTITRKQFLQEVEKALDVLNVGDFISAEYCTLTIEYVVQNGVPHIVVGERRTMKPIVMKK